MEPNGSRRLTNCWPSALVLVRKQPLYPSLRAKRSNPGGLRARLDLGCFAVARNDDLPIHLFADDSLVPAIHELLRPGIASRDGPPGATFSNETAASIFLRRFLFRKNRNDARVVFELFRPPPIPVEWARPFELGLEWTSRREMAAQRIEKIESAPGKW